MLNEDGGQRPAREMLFRSSFFLAVVSLVCVIVKSQGKNVKNDFVGLVAYFTSLLSSYKLRCGFLENSL